MAATKDREMTHDEVWDDSALLDSWNDAFEEYQKYHSLAAKGEKVEPKQDALQEHIARTKAATPTTNGISNAPFNFIGPAANAQTQAASGATSSTQASLGPSGLASLPQTLLGNPQDDTLKSLMMSWYYAGYYTGFYEGQQKAWSDMQQMQQQQQQEQEPKVPES